MDFIPTRNDCLGGIRLCASGQYCRWHAGLHHSRLPEITPWIDDDLPIFSQRPPDDVRSGELEFFLKRRHNPGEFDLIVYQVNESFVTILLALSQENTSAIRKNAIGAKRMGGAQLILRFPVGAAHRSPAHARANECIDKAELKEVAKAEGQLILDRSEFALPDRLGMMHALAAFEIVALQPSSDFSGADPGQARRLWDRVEAGVKEVGVTRLHQR